MTGFVYFMRAAGTTGPIKIGFTGNVEKRLAAINCMSPVKLEIIKSVRGNRADEGHLHSVFSADRSHGEWFHASERLLGFIDVASDLSDMPPGKHKLCEYLATIGMSQTDFAKVIGEGQVTLNRYVRFERRIPLETIALIDAITDGFVSWRDWLPPSTGAAS